ncbi:hypothetical protein HZC07_00465, partial [Candidatus Micrarchaeota archaeon]|nr:hypothetical protein [Candidatus Micrarchaeota archaeon]
HTKLDQSGLDFIDSLDAADKSRFMNYADREIRLLEYCIAEGDPLYILGSAQPQTDVTEGSSSVGYENLIVKKGSDKIMYISNSNEKAIVAKLIGSMYWQIFGGLILSSICLLVILGYLGVGI